MRAGHSMGQYGTGRRSPFTFLGRLARDVRGNTLAIMAAALVPLAGMIGGGLDLSRMYIVKTRLQHACDAGALAGRKAMGAGTWAQQNNMPNATAERFFKANYAVGSYGSSALAYNFSENAGKVTGTASAQLPLTLTKVLFGAVWSAANSMQTLAVSCATEMRLPNTDVMFVLDTTGSMADIQPGDTVSKMSALKTAVKCFYEIVARLDTDATCTTGAPSGGTGSQVQIRFGFVPFSTNVNIGKLLPTSYFADSWSYQTRYARWWVLKNQIGPAESPVAVPTAQIDCTYANAKAAGYVYTKENFSGNNTKRTVETQDLKNQQVNWNAGICSGIIVYTKKQFDLGENVTPTANDEFIDWHYGQLAQNVSGLKSGSGWNNSMQLYLGANGAQKTIAWDGCVEERQTARAASYTPLPSGAKDLDVDLVPNASDATTLWGPVLPDVIYTRNGYSGWTQAESYTATDYGNQSQYYCPRESRLLQTWPDANAFDTYVDSLNPTGNTYHDLGLLWAARLTSPTGIFAATNAFTPQGGEIQRNIIFMTDGDACTQPSNYQAYGVAWFDRRTIDPNVAPANVQNCTGGAPITDQVNARTEALCSIIKNKNITLWVVAFGSLAPATVTRLTNCASSGKYFTATNAAQLQATFKSIADQISMLRLTQ